MSLFYKIFFTLIPISTVAQIDYGIRTGINLTNNSNISIISQDFDSNISKDNMQGFFLGGFISLEGVLFNLRTEIQYNQTKNKNNLTQNKIEAPITIGYKILPFVSTFIGPSFQYILSEKSSLYNIDAIEDNTTMGLNLGARIYLGKIQLDVRYERGLNSMETKIISQNNLDLAKIDTRASLLSFGLSYKIN
tara:strand:+ start:896 stop:1471 length:576 start_codon:yes stop_codon:yes gene_type:complete